MEYEWYVDVFFLTNFFMDAAGMLAAAAVCSRPVKYFRLLAFCGLFVLCSMLLFVFCPKYWMYRLLVHLVCNPLMTLLIFRPERWQELFRLLLTVYTVFFFVGGVQESLRRIVGNGSLQIAVCGICAAGMFLIYLQRQKTMRYVCTVDLWLGEEKIRVSAYCDSGNLLRNPKSGKPVSVLEKETAKQWNTEALQQDLISCHTIGNGSALIPVITIDKMDIYQKGTKRQIKTPEIGLHEGTLMAHPPVQMLLHEIYMG